MADIEVIVKIPEKTYKRIQALVRDDYFEHDICGDSMRRIADGTPLPKGHGDIVDIEKLIDMFWDGNSMEITKYDLSVIEPIIEADREVNDERIR